jgi:hypothetical protein
MRRCSGTCETTTAIRGSVLTETRERYENAASGKGILSICWSPRRPYQSRGGSRGPPKCPQAINCGPSSPWTPQVSCLEIRVSSRRGTPAPGCRRDEEKGNIVKEVKDVSGGCRWKGTGLRESPGLSLALMRHNDRSCSHAQACWRESNPLWQMPMLTGKARQSEHMADDGTRRDDCGDPTGKSCRN